MDDGFALRLWYEVLQKSIQTKTGANASPLGIFKFPAQRH